MQLRKIAAAFAALIFLSVSGSGQSLGEVARAQRQKQTGKALSSQSKIITDDDLPSRASDPKADAKPTDAQSTKSDTPINSSSNGEELKAMCLSAKQEIKNSQNELDKLRASIQYVEANRYSNGVEYNQHQQQKQQEADRMQKQLDQAKKKFEDLQERARKAGFGSAVYDP